METISISYQNNVFKLLSETTEYLMKVFVIMV